MTEEQNQQIIALLIVLLTMFVKWISDNIKKRRVEKKLSEIDKIQNAKIDRLITGVDELKQGQILQKQINQSVNNKLNDVVDFNNNHKYIHLLEVQVLQIFDDFVNDNFIENKETILLLHNIKVNLTDFYTKIVLAGWRYFDYQKLTKAWENFYTKAKRPISTCRLNIIGKPQEKQFTEEIDRIIIEEFSKNYFNTLVSVFQLENGERKEEFNIITEKITKQLILTVISVINKYKQ